MNRRPVAAALLAAIVAPASGVAGADRPPGGGGAVIREFVPVANRLFDANHCMERIVPSGDGVAFHWGCGDRKLVSMECVYDAAGFRDLAPTFAPRGWHCNRPLPKIAIEGNGRIGDVAVRSVGDGVAWAACFVESYGDFATREKPYHGTACYRALMRLHEEVNRTQRNPGEVAREILR